MNSFQQGLVRFGLMLMLLLPLGALAACVVADGGIGGIGMPQLSNAVASEGGIGGTGAQASGGIGGTGIVGTITGFASVCINGLEVNYDDATQVRSNGDAAGIHQLAVGQVIAIDAVGADHGMLARSIDILNAVEGPVTAAKVADGSVEVMGQKVRLSDVTKLGGIADAQEITVGMPLKVSGYRNAANEIVATRIEIARDMAAVSIVGVVARNSAGQFAVSGTPVQMEKSKLVAGAEVLLKGKWDGKQLHAESVLHDPSLPFAGHVDQVAVEGLVVGRMDGTQMKISGFDIDYSSSTSVKGESAGQLMQGNLVRVTGQMRAGHRVQANHIEIMRRPDAVNRKSGVMSDEKERMNHESMTQPMRDMGQNRPTPMMRR